MAPAPDPGGSKTFGSYGSRFGFATHKLSEKERLPYCQSIIVPDAGANILALQWRMLHQVPPELVVMRACSTNFAFSFWYDIRKAMLWTRIGFNADPDLDQAFNCHTNPDPDPGSQTNADPRRTLVLTLPSQKVEFLHVKYTLSMQ